MTIGIDASRAVNEGAGIGRYTREVVRWMIDLAEGDRFQLFFTFVRDDGHKRRWIEDVRSHREHVEVKTATIPGQLKEWLWGKRWWGIKKYMPEADVLFAPSFFEVALGEKTPQVVTVHDLSHALFPDQRGEQVSRRLTERDRRVASKAVRIIAVSQATKDELTRLYGVDPAKITVIPEGYNTFFQPVAGVERQPFFLFVGTVSPRKNLAGLFQAYAQLPPEIREEYRLKVVGAEGWNTNQIFQTYQNLKLEGEVEFLGYQGDEALRTLYNQAAAFLFPSLYEGFGIPILEAMACGCPVITSNISSMPEVAGEAALLVDPSIPQEITEAMMRVATEPKLWAQLHRAGLERVKDFSWEKTARRTLEMLHEIGEQATRD